MHDRLDQSLHRLASTGTSAGGSIGMVIAGHFGLRLPLVCVRSECVVGRIRLECNTNWFVKKTGLETQLTSNFNYQHMHMRTGMTDCARWTVPDPVLAGITSDQVQMNCWT